MAVLSSVRRVTLWWAPVQPLVLTCFTFAIIGVMSLTPVFFILINSFNIASPARPFSFGVEGWSTAFSDPRILRAIGTTLLLLLRTPFSLIVGFLIAWLLARIKFPGKDFIEVSLWFAYFLPPLPIIMSWILLVDPHYGLLNQWIFRHLDFSLSPFSLYGIIWIHLTTTSIPVTVVLLTPALRQMDASLEEVGRVCGANLWLRMRRIVVPLLTPALLTVFIASLIRGLEAFQVELLLGTPAKIFVFSTRIYDMINSEPADWPAAMSLSTLFLGVLFVLALFYFWMSSAQAATISGRGVSFRQMDIGRGKYLISGVLSAWVLISLYIPLIVLLMGTFMRRFGFFEIANPFTLAHWVDTLTYFDFTSALRTTILMGLGVGILGVTVYFIIGYLLVRSPIKGKGALSVLVWLPWAVPGILLGLAFLWFFLVVPLARTFYGTVTSLILVLVVQELPIGVHLAKSAFAQVAEELEQVGRICGAGWFRTYRKVMLPLIAPVLVAVFVLTFMVAVRAVDSVILLGSAANRPLSLLMMEYVMTGRNEAASILGVIISIIATMVLLVARRFGMRLGLQ